jgi:hypothetical protein
MDLGTVPLAERQMSGMGVCTDSKVMGALLAESWYSFTQAHSFIIMKK